MVKLLNSLSSGARDASLSPNTLELTDSRQRIAGQKPWNDVRGAEVVSDHKEGAPSTVRCLVRKLYICG